MKNLIQLLIILLISKASAQNNYTQFVNPFVGTGGHGHTFPGATLPFAMVQLSPDTRVDGSWDGCSGYHYSDSVIHAFSHTHLSGTGCSDYGDVGFMVQYANGKQPDLNQNFSEKFNHKNEKASPGFYSVKLNSGIQVELTSSLRTGWQKYTFPKAGKVWLSLDLRHRDKLLKGKIYQVNATTFNGFRRSEAWAKDQLLYYQFEVNTTPSNSFVFKDERGELRLILEFQVKKGAQLLVKTGISSADEAGAASNLKQESPNWDFNKMKANANAEWNKELSRIKAFGGTEKVKKNFYTALYHCMIHPNVMNDVDGRYRGRDGKIHKAEGFNYYTVFSLWDTYRAQHPLLNVIDKKRSHDFMMTFKAQFQQSGRLPMWELWGNETDCMIGFHSVSVICNAYMNGVINKAELDSLWPAVEAEVLSNRHGLDRLRMNGFLSVEDESESVSKTLEYSFNMHCAYIISRILNKRSSKVNPAILERYAYAWINLYDFESGMMVPRENGNKIKDYDPRQVNNHFTEANAWQYAFAVQHDLYRVTDDAKLTSLFNSDPRTTGREQADITGLIGQYAHGNEPSHHVAYLYKNRDSAQKYISKICADFYHPTPDGLSGNEDCGQMSAWYVFSAMGLYPINPSTNYYKEGFMLFDSVQIQTGESKSVWIRKNNQIQPSDILETMGYVYKLDTGIINLPLKKVYHEPQLVGIENQINSGYAPLIVAEKQIFEDSLLVELVLPKIKFKNEVKEIPGVFMKYSFDRNLPFSEWKEYHNSFVIKKSTPLFASMNGSVSSAYFMKKPNNFSVSLMSKYNKQYTGGGPLALVDGLKGDADWRKGRWQGYQSQDFEAVVDMKKESVIDSVKIGFLQDTRSWILFPKWVEVFGSSDSVNYTSLGIVNCEIADTMMNSTRMEFILKVKADKASCKYLKVRAKNYGTLPPWHQGAGGEAYIFVDEITVINKE